MTNNNNELRLLANNEEVMKVIIDCLDYNVDALKNDIAACGTAAYYGERNSNELAIAKRAIDQFLNCYKNSRLLTLNIEAIDEVIKCVKGHIFFIADYHNSDHLADSRDLIKSANEILRLNQFLIVYENTQAIVREELLAKAAKNKMLPLIDEEMEADMLKEQFDGMTMTDVIEEALTTPIDYSYNDDYECLDITVGEYDEHYTYSSHSYVDFLKYAKSQMDEDNYSPRLVVGKKVLHIDYLPLDDLCALSADNDIIEANGSFYLKL